MSKTIEEIKEEFLKELNKTNQLILGAYKNAVDRLNKEKQELQEQNAELVMTLETIASLITNQTSMSTVKASLLQILTKHNHLNKKP